VAVAVFPLASVTVQVTVVFPEGKVAGALFVTEATEQLSLNSGDPRFTFSAVHPVVEDTVTLAGAVTVGAMTSVTVTV
jgi:hypothetical protein